MDADTIKKAGFKVVVDGVNSTGGIAIPKLLEELGVEVGSRAMPEPKGKECDLALLLFSISL